MDDVNEGGTRRGCGGPGSSGAPAKRATPLDRPQMHFWALSLSPGFTQVIVMADKSGHATGPDCRRRQNTELSESVRAHGAVALPSCQAIDLLRLAFKEALASTTCCGSRRNLSHLTAAACQAGLTDTEALVRCQSGWISG